MKNIKYYIKTKCIICKKEILRNKYQLKRCKPCCSMQCILKYKQSKEKSKILGLINTPDFYYLVGLICADGHINWPGCTPGVKHYACTISLHNNDQQLLKNIKNKFGGKICNNTCGTVKKWYINSKQFIEYLKNEVGLTNNKSLTLDISKWYKGLDEEYKHCFIRGVVDGDGSIYCDGQGIWRFAIITGSKLFSDILKEYFKQYNMKYREHLAPTSKNTMYTVQLNGKYSIPALHKIYNITEGNLYLKRKYNKYINLVEHFNKEIKK